jgi:hypothetical protein
MQDHFRPLITKFLETLRINPLKPNGNYMSHLLNSSFCIYGFRMILTVNSDYFLKPWELIL